MANRTQPKRMKKPSVYFDNQSGRYICDFHELSGGEIKQRRLKFKTESQAEVERKKREALRNRAMRRGKGALTDAQVETSIWLFNEIESLDWDGVTVRLVMDHFRKTYNPVGSKPFSEAIADFESFKKGSGIKDSSFKDIPPRLKKLNEYFRGSKVGDLNSSDFLNYVGRQSEGMRYKIYALVREFLDYESNEGRGAPMFPRKLLKEYEFESKKGKRFKVERTAPPTILHIGEVKAALKLASTFRVKQGELGEWLAFFVLGTYCGLRPHEIQALGRIQRGEMAEVAEVLGPDYVKLGKKAVWEKHIQLTKGVIVCDDKIGTKTGERRNVKILPNVSLWLNYIKRKELPLCVCDSRFARYAKYFRIAVMDDRRQGNKLWDDVFRHTFATFLWNSNGMTESEYCSQMGHSLKVAKQNYLGDLHDAETSEEFFSITPKNTLAAKSNRL